MNTPTVHASYTLREYKKEHKIKQITKDDGHYYTSDTHPSMYPSVTTIFGTLNKGGLAGWHDRLTRSKFHELLIENITDGGMPVDIAELKMYLDAALKESDRVRDAAAEFGTYVHALIEQYCSQHDGSIPNIPLYEDATPEQLDHYNHAVDFLAKHEIKPISAEYMIYSPARHHTGLLQKTPGYGGTVDLIAYHEPSGEYCIVDWKTGNSKQPTHLTQLAAYAHAVPLDIPRAYVYYTKRDTYLTLQGSDMAYQFEKFTKIAAAWDAVNDGDLFI